jgi:ankyrin repeat protein
MWAAYQGDALSVELLLKHGASPNTKDDTGLTPLHWAVVRGNRTCIRRLIEKGGEVGAKDEEGRTPRDMAVELKSLGAWKRALEEGGMNEEGVKRRKPFSEVSCFFSPYTCCLIFGLGTAEYENSDLHTPNDIFLPDVHDSNDITMVHRYHPRHGRILWDASCEHLLHSIYFIAQPNI